MAGNQTLLLFFFSQLKNVLINRPKDVLGCSAAPEEFSFTAFLCSVLVSRFSSCVCAMGGQYVCGADGHVRGKYYERHRARPLRGKDLTEADLLRVGCPGVTVIGR